MAESTADVKLSLDEAEDNQSGHKSFERRLDNGANFAKCVLRTLHKRPRLYM